MNALAPVLEGMVLTVTERCNLRCRYCYVPVSRGRTMAPEVADAAVDLLLAHARPAHKVRLSFFGGEPFLSPQLLQRVVARTRAGVGDRDVEVAAPTNGLAVSAEDLAWCRDEKVNLAVSIDGGAQLEERAHADGSACGAQLHAAGARIIENLPANQALARMTVTPSNVDNLCANLRQVSRLGFSTIVYQADLDATWSDQHIAAWRREHRRIAAWLLDARATRERVPRLPAWEAIAARLRGAPRTTCGAGVRHVAVTTSGRIVPCYRFAYAKQALTLGHVHEGFTNARALDDLSQLSPEQGSCSSCSAQDGCTHFCPAIGWNASGELRAVPAVACRLMQAQVAAVRPMLIGARKFPSQSPVRWAAAAMLAAMVGSTGACGGSSDSFQGAVDAGVDAPVPQDAAPDIAITLPQGGPDVRAVADGGADGGVDTNYPYIGGLCP